MITKHSVRTVRKPCSKCHSSDLYWGHDDDPAARQGHYCQEHTSSNWTLINRDGTRHDCQHDGSVHDEPTVTDTADRAKDESNYQPWAEDPKPTAPPVAAPTAS